MVDDLSSVRVFDPPYWYVAFHRRPRLYWFDWLVWGNDFRHVSVFGHVPESDAWVWASCTRHGVVIEAVPGPAVAGRLAAAAASGPVLRVAKGEASPASWPPLYCVSFVCRVLNVPLRALTPYGLFRQLLRNGAQRVLDDEPKASEGRPGGQTGA